MCSIMVKTKNEGFNIKIHMRVNYTLDETLKEAEFRYELMICSDTKINESIGQ